MCIRLLFILACVVLVHSAPITFGVLNAQLENAQDDYAAGVRAAAFDIYWSDYELNEGNFSGAYVSMLKDRMKPFQDRGFDLTIGVNFHRYPDWLLRVPGANYTNQRGVVQPGANIIFSQTMRNKAMAYMTKVRDAFGTNFNVRVGFAPDAGELLYPRSSANKSSPIYNSFWCFDKNAQGTGNDRPANTSACPYPGWIPGSTTYRGAPFTRDMADTYYKWYIASLVKAGDWMQAAYVKLGFTGKVEWLMPGSGMRPFDYTRFVDQLLLGNNSYDEDHGPRGGVWHRVIDSIANKTNIMIQISSIADVSGTPRANNCTAADKNIVIESKQMASWSSARWISFNADRYNLPKSGENSGRLLDLETMKMAGNLVRSCNLVRWYYAHDISLHDGRKGAATINDYAAVIRSLASSGTAAPRPPTPKPTAVPTPRPTTRATQKPTSSPTSAPGDGLRGFYYSDTSLTKFVASRIDAIVNFTWSGAPSGISGMPADNFGVQWRGQVQPRCTGTYTFYTLSDDGVRLWVNGQQLIDNWTAHGATEDSGTITLTAGQKYNIRLDFEDLTFSAKIVLSWQQGSCESKAIIPRNRLFSAAP